MLKSSLLPAVMLSTAALTVGTGAVPYEPSASLLRAQLENVELEYEIGGAPDGEPVLLSVNEFRLLQLLMSRAESVVTTGELLRHVWGYDEDPASNVVDVYVRYLRNRLGQATGDRRAFIATIRGEGYRFDAPSHV